MRTKLYVAAAVLTALAFVMPIRAYDIKDAPAGTLDANDPTEWGAAIGASDPTCNLPGGCSGDPTAPLCDTLTSLNVPTVETAEDVLCGTQEDENGQCEGVIGYCAGALLLGLTACEHNPTASSPGTAGQGGLCFMSPGFSGNPCAFVGAATDNGNSNGNAPNYGGGACQDPTKPLAFIEDPAEQWYNITMTANPDGLGGAVQFVAQINGVSCAVSGHAVVYDDQFAYMVSNGHVSGFVTVEPAAGHFGGYAVAFDGADGGAADNDISHYANNGYFTACAGASPFFAYNGP